METKETIKNNISKKMNTWWQYDSVVLQEKVIIKSHASCTRCIPLKAPERSSEVFFVIVCNKLIHGGLQRRREETRLSFQQKDLRCWSPVVTDRQITVMTKMRGVSCICSALGLRVTCTSSLSFLSFL